MLADQIADYASADVHARYGAVEQAEHADAQKLMAFWQARPSDGIVMGRDVPSRAIAGLLKNIAILEPTADRTDMHIRLAGASLLKRWGGDVKGRMLSQLFSPGEFRDHLAVNLAVIDGNRPAIVDSRLTAGPVDTMHMEVVLLPVVSPDHKSRWVLSGLFYFG